MSIPNAVGWHIHVYAGQSNECEVGLGSWSDTTSAYDSRIFQVGRLNGNNMQIIPAVRSLDYWTASTGHGAGLSRARLYIQNGHLPDGYNLLVIPAAEGGTTILYWDGTVSNGDDLFGDMVSRVNLGLSLPNARITMFVWRQIETDIALAGAVENPLHSQMPDACTWYKHSLAFIDRVRQVTGSCPIIYTQPPTDYLLGNVLKTQFLLALESLAAARPQCIVSSSAGLSSNMSFVNGGEIHFSAASQEVIAARNIVDFESLHTRLVANFLGTP